MFQWTFSLPPEPVASWSNFLSSNPEAMIGFSTLGPRTFHQLQTSFTAAYLQVGLPPRRHVLPFPATTLWERLYPSARVETEEIRITYPSVQAFLRAIKYAGADCASTRPTPIPREVYLRMCEYYATHFPAPQQAGIQVTYEAVYVILTDLSAHG
ncbi:MAG: hypothetical protein D6820_18400 [Lentisphaerae bacterium]|nr:MAG: hypothetical protein D6820_18400 [Lentisphaerota bacterium]